MSIEKVMHSEEVVDIEESDQLYKKINKFSHSLRSRSYASYFLILFSEYTNN